MSTARQDRPDRPGIDGPRLHQDRPDVANVPNDTKPQPEPIPARWGPLPRDMN